MIRFVDIRNQGIGYRFSFWDTITDKYICHNGEYAWNNWDDFVEIIQDDINVERYKRLCPTWVFDGGKDSIDAF